MKKLALLILFIQAIAFTSNAQIQRLLLGFTLGASNRATVVKTLNSKGFILELITEAANQGPIFYQVKGGVSLGGYIWDDVRIGFVNGKFSSIMCASFLSDDDFSKLKIALWKKYKKYSTENTNHSDSVYDYNDKKNICKFV